MDTERPRRTVADLRLEATNGVAAHLSEAEVEWLGTESKWEECAYMALEHTMELMRRARRGDTPVVEFLRIWFVINAYLERLEDIDWNLWPSGSGASFADRAGRTALEVAVQYSAMMRNAARPQSGLQPDDQVQPTPSASVIQWVMAGQEAVDLSTPSEAEWPDWQRERDLKLLQIRLHRELMETHVRRKPKAEPLDDTGASSTRPGKAAPNVFRRDGDFWTVTFAGKTAPPVKHRLPLEYLAFLLSRPHERFSAADLVGVIDPPPRPEGGLTDSHAQEVGLSIGSLQEGVPMTSRVTIRNLRKARAESVDRIAEARLASKGLEEIEEMEEELRRIESRLDADSDLHGRPRATGDDRERVRKRVANSLARARANMADVHEQLAQHLIDHLSDAPNYSYTPDVRMDWEI